MTTEAQRDGDGRDAVRSPLNRAERAAPELAAEESATVPFAGARLTALGVAWGCVLRDEDAMVYRMDRAAISAGIRDECEAEFRRRLEVRA